MKNTQVKAIDVQAIIDNNNLNLVLSKEGKKWVLDDRKFDNLKQVVSYVSGLTTIRSTGRAIEKTAKQGEDGITINPDKVIVLAQSCHAPVPNTIQDKKATKEFQASGGFGKVVVDQLKFRFKYDHNGNKVMKNGKPVMVLPDELNQVSSIKTEWAKVLNKWCLQYEIGGNRVVSIHHVDKIKEAAKTVNDNLQKIVAEIVAKLPDWKDEAKAVGCYVDGKWPSVNTFADEYKLSCQYTPVGESFRDLDSLEDDLKRNAFGNIRSDLESFLESVTAYLADDAKKFRDSHFANMSESLEVIKASGVVSGEKVEKLIEIAEKAIDTVKPQAIREAKQKLDKGVVVATAKRGRKPAEVSTDDLKNCEAYLDTALDPLKALAEELEGLC